MSLVNAQLHDRNVRLRIDAGLAPPNCHDRDPGARKVAPAAAACDAPVLRHWVPDTARRKALGENLRSRGEFRRQAHGDGGILDVAIRLDADDCLRTRQFRPHPAPRFCGRIAQQSLAALIRGLQSAAHESSIRTRRLARGRCRQGFTSMFAAQGCEQVRRSARA